MLVLIVMTKCFRFHKFICMQYKIKAFTILSLSCTNIVMLILILLLLLSGINRNPVLGSRHRTSSFRRHVVAGIFHPPFYQSHFPISALQREPLHFHRFFMKLSLSLSLSLKSVHLLHLTIVLRFMILLILSATHIK